MIDGMTFTVTAIGVASETETFDGTLIPYSLR